MNYKVLVNKDNLVKDKYLDKIDLVEYFDILNNKILVEKQTLESYLELKKFLEEKNIEIGISSAYRTLQDQQEIIDEYTKKYGEDFEKKYVAPVRASEHHTGLALDIRIKENNEFIVEDKKVLKNVEPYEQIEKYFHEFGFILRYKKGKEDITGYSYEPWHIRYVGKVVAKIIYENDWTLEEYLTKFSGVLVVNKKKGVTSFDVVNDISHIFGIKRVGHTGTLDPLAEGVLVVTIGKATKIAELLTAKYKEYIAGVILGIKTDTYDIEGKVIDSKEVPDNLDLEKTISNYKKTYLQEVPIYSAVKVNGKKLYEYARNNESVELPKKEVTIKEIELLSSDRNEFMFKSLVSKGCYIRSLINDIGESLNTYATMTKLTRTKLGKFTLENSNTLEDIKNNNYKLYSIDNALDYPIVEIDNDLYKKISNGVKIKNTYNIEDKVIFKYNNTILGIYQKDEDMLKTWKNFN